MNLMVPSSSPSLNNYVYTSFHLNCLACLALREEQSEGGTLWRQLRDFLFRLLQSLKASLEQAQSQFTLSMEQFLLIAHYYANRAVCKEVQALQPVALRLSLALLRHTDLLPVDKGFYEAGMDLRQAGRESEAFVMLNHYLDVCEAIEEGSGQLVDHSDLASTDFPSNECEILEELDPQITIMSLNFKQGRSGNTAIGGATLATIELESRKREN